MLLFEDHLIGILLRNYANFRVAILTLVVGARIYR